MGSPHLSKLGYPSRKLFIATYSSKSSRRQTKDRIDASLDAEFGKMTRPAKRWIHHRSIIIALALSTVVLKI